MEKEFLYKNIAEKINTQIENGVLKSGDKLPSVRQLSEEHGVSVTTVLQTYAYLESLGLVEAKPQSGYYVSLRSKKKLPEPEVLNLATVVKRFSSDELVSNVHDLAKIPNITSLGAGIPCTDILPAEKFKKTALSILKSSESGGITYEFPPGNEKLISEITKKSFRCGCNFKKEEIIITSGAIEALYLALSVICKPGDTVITESPTYYVILQMLKNLGLKTLEIPTHPRDGILIDALERAIQDHNVSACILYPTVNNPLGSVISQENREKIYKIISNYNLPLIEGDVYGELVYENVHPKPIKALDDKGLVLYYSSFSKTVAPGYRIGWICPGKYYDDILNFKFINTIGTTSLSQMVMAEFLKANHFEKSIKELKKIYQSRINILSGYISEYFPEGTKLTRPKGGFYLWVELPKGVDSVKLQRRALEENISIAPGPMFSTKDDFSNYIRLSCACPWTPKIEMAIKRLGELIREMM